MSMDSESGMLGLYTTGVLLFTPDPIQTDVPCFKGKNPWPLDDGGLFEPLARINGQRRDSNPQSIGCRPIDLPY